MSIAKTFFTKEIIMNACVVGIGSVAPLHINALLECGQSIVALCDVLPEKAEAAKEKFNLDCKIYSDYYRMVDELKPDVVHLSVPHYLHADFSCYALERGVSVVSEKPVATSLEDVERIKKAVNGTKAIFGVCQQNRYNSSVRYVKELFGDEPIQSAAANLVWKRDADYYKQSGWRGRWATEGGGLMINQALHTLDLLQWFCGMPKSVTASVSNLSLQGVIEVEDTASGIFQVDDERRFVITATNAAVDCYPITFHFRSKNHEVTMVGDNIIADGKFVVRSDGKPLYGKDVYGNGHAKLIADFYDCIETGRKFPIGIEEAQKVVKLIFAMYRSNGEKVDVE